MASGRPETTRGRDGREPAAVFALDTRIARWERRLDALVLCAGLGVLVLWPDLTVLLRRPTLLVMGGIALLGAGLLRDLAWLALAGRPVPPRRTGPPEVRLCLESTLGVLALAAGLGWRAWAPGEPQPVGVGALVVTVALIAVFGQLTRNVIVAARLDPGHRGLPFWS